MKRKHVFWAGVLLALIFILGTNLLSFQQTANELYQAAVLKKSGDGNLEEAIKLFQKIVDNFPDNRELASQALLQIGLCYDLLGEEKAEATFRKLIVDYPDQKDTVQVAIEKLALLTKKTATNDPLPRKLTLRKVFSPNQESGPRGTPSPNGQYLAFIDWDRGNNLSLFDLRTRKVIPITTYKPDDNSWCDDPVWTNDSLQIAFMYHTPDQKSELHIIRISDKKDKYIYRDSFQDSEKCVVDIAGWSPDNRKIYVDIQYDNYNRSLGYISIDFGQLTEIMHLGRTIPYSSRVSPEGKFIAYSFRDESGNMDIQSISVDGKENHLLVANPAGDLFLGWTPDGNHILFESDRSGSKSIWLLPVQNGFPNGEPTSIHNLTGNLTGYGFTGSGTFYFAESNWENDAYTAQIDLNTGKILKDPEQIEKASKGHTRTPFWSHDGKYLGYFVEHGPGWDGGHSLKIRTLATGEIREWLLDFSPSEYFQLPKWTKDGKHILVVGIKKFGEGTSLYRIDIKTGQSQRVIDTNRIQAFSHDASLVYRLESTRTRNMLKRQSWLFLRTEDGKERELITPPIGSRIGNFTLSPNKKWLGFVMSKRTEKESIQSWKIMPAEGGDNLDLSKKFDILGPFYWGPHKNGIIIRKLSKNTDAPDYWYIPNFLENMPLIKLKFEMPGIKDISFHPDGLTFAFTAQPYTSKFWTMENYLPPKKEK